MSGRSCPDDVELGRALSVGADPELATHLATCEACGATTRALRAAIELARELPAEIPSATHREDVRTTLLAQSARRPAPRRRARWAIPIVALAAAAAVIVQLARPASHRAPHPIVARGIVHPHGEARYELSTPPDEVVQLHDGAIDVHVDPLGLGERFRVRVGADEVEVRGTAFEVIASADHLLSVHVVHGRVEVRRVGQRMISLSAGEAWQAPVAAAVAAINPPAPPPSAPPSAPPIAPAPAHHLPAVPQRAPATLEAAIRAPVPSEPAITVAPPPAAATPSAPDETAFVSAWNAMRRHDFAHASAAFARVLVLSPEGRLAEDATYWLAVATARIPQPANAITAFREFLARYPHSARAGEASAMLGWLLVDVGDRVEARRRFDAASTDRSPGVRASARAGLAELGRP